MAKEKACKQCRKIYEGTTCPSCGSKENSDTFKGKVYVLNPEQSELAQKLLLKLKGLFAIRLR